MRDELSVTWTSEQIVAADKRTLQARRDAIELAMLQIRNQLAATETREFTGSAEDRADWIRRANSKLRYLGFEHQLILRRLGEMKREQSRTDSHCWEREFVEAARDILDSATIDRIAALVSARMEQAHNAQNQENGPCLSG